MAELKRVDPTRRRNVFVRAFVAVGTTRPARFVSRHVLWKLDVFLLRISGDRFSTTFPIRTAVLETTGAKTGAQRRNAVIYFHEGADVVLVASHAGYPRHPAWYHNLRANPDVTFGGVTMRATVETDEADRERLWPLADNVLPAYAKYRRQAATAGRSIPLVRLARR